MRVFRLPRSAYLAVLFLLFCTVPLALASDGGHGITDSDTGISGFQLSPLILLLLIPVLAAVFIARTATIADASGIRVRAVFGSRSLPWEGVRGLSVGERAIYAVTDDGAVRLPCVRVANLHELAAVSEGHLPEIAKPVLKPAPMKRRR